MMIGLSELEEIMDYGITRERALELLNQHLTNRNLYKHSLASEAVMRALARYFSEDEEWYEDLVWKTLKNIASETNCIVEVNTRGLYKKRAETFFPSPRILEQVFHRPQ